jgi:hypothetical protein
MIAYLIVAGVGYVLGCATIWAFMANRVDREANRLTHGYLGRLETVRQKEAEEAQVVPIRQVPGGGHQFSNPGDSPTVREF